MVHPVEVYIYDLSRGLGRSLGPALGLHDIEGIWHTAIVVHGTEIFFGAGGIEHCIPGSTILGQPLEKKLLGNTNIDIMTLTNYLRTIGRTEYDGSTYDLFKHNCNNFSSDLTKFLGVEDIPRHILDLPNRFLSSPMAAMLRPLIEQVTPSGEAFTTSNGFADDSGSFVYVPPKEYSIISTPINVDKVMAKLIDFNDKNSVAFRITNDHLTRLRLLDESGVRLDKEIIDDVFKPALDKWPNEDTFPLLHIICANVGREGTDKAIALNLYSLVKANKMLQYGPNSPQMRMTLRLLVAFFANASSRSVMINDREDLVGQINSVVESTASIDDTSPQVEAAITSLVINYAKAINDDEVPDGQEASFQLLSGLCTTFLDNLKGPDAVFKTLVAVGTLARKDGEAKDLVLALDLKARLDRIPKGRLDRLDSCISECRKIID